MTIDLGLRKAARVLDISHPYLSKLAGQKRVSRNADKTFNVETVRREMEAFTDPAMVRRKGHRKTRERGHEAAVTTPARKPVVTTPDEARAAVGLILKVLRGEGSTIEDAVEIDYDMVRMADTILKAYERELSMAQKRGQLIDKEKVKQTVFNLARHERDTWLTWPARISALMAADLRIDAHSLQTVLGTYVRQHLTELSEIRLDLK